MSADINPKAVDLRHEIDQDEKKYTTRRHDDGNTYEARGDAADSGERFDWDNGNAPEADERGWDPAKQGDLDFATSSSLHRSEIGRRYKAVSVSGAFNPHPPDNAERKGRRARRKTTRPVAYGKRYKPTYRADSGGRRPKWRWGSSETPVRRKGDWAKRDAYDDVAQALELGYKLGEYSIEKRTGNDSGRPVVGDVAGAGALLDATLSEGLMSRADASATNRKGRPAVGRGFPSGVTNPLVRLHREWAQIALATAVVNGANVASLVKESGFSKQRISEAVAAYGAVVRLLGRLDDEDFRELRETYAEDVFGSTEPDRKSDRKPGQSLVSSRGNLRARSDAQDVQPDAPVRRAKTKRKLASN